MASRDGQYFSWRLKVPLEIVLSENEIAVPSKPPSLHLMLPRHAYLASVIPPALTLFQDFVTTTTEITPWFEHRGQTIRPLHVPLGVIYDWLQGEKGELKLVLHLRGYPRQILPDPAAYGPLTNPASPYQATHFNSLKEAACICTGNANAILTLTNEQRSELWDIAMSSDLSKYLAHAAPLLPSPQGWGSHPREPWCPLRVLQLQLRGDQSAALQRTFSGRLTAVSPRNLPPPPPLPPRVEGTVFISRPVPLLTSLAPLPPPSTQEPPTEEKSPEEDKEGEEEGEERGAEGEGPTDRGTPPSLPSGEFKVWTLADALEFLRATTLRAPLASPSTPPPSSSSEDASGSATTEKEGSASPRHFAAPTAPKEIRVRCAGVEIPLETKLQWLYEQLRAPDGFLYLVVEVVV